MVALWASRRTNETLVRDYAAPPVPLVRDEDARARKDSHRWLGATPGSAVLAGEEVGALDVGHGFGECRVAEPSFHLLGGEVLDVCLDPPQVAQRVAHAPDTVAEEQVGDLGHAGAAGRDGLAVDGVGVCG